MIRAVVGVPGSGKSLFLVERAIYYLKQGRPVYSNFPIRGCYEFSLDDLIEHSFPENSVVLIDEAGRLFNSRNWKDLPPEVFDLFTMHRHLNIEMYVGVQAFNRIDSSLREVIEITYVAQKGMFGLRHYYRGYYEVQRVGKIKGSEDIFCSVWFPRRIYKYYDTFAMKAVWMDKPMIINKPYQPLPLTKREKLKLWILKKLRLDQETRDLKLVEKKRREIYKSWLSELDYEEQLHIKNYGLGDWLQLQEESIQLYTRKHLHWLDI